MSILSLSSVSRLLPISNGDMLRYDSVNRLYYTNGWTSAACNTYNRGFRISSRLVIEMRIGQGYCRTFINGISIYIFNGHSIELINSKNYDCCFFSNMFIDSECKKMVEEYVTSQKKLLGAYISESEIKRVSSAMVDETYGKLLN